MDRELGKNERMGNRGQRVSGWRLFAVWLLVLAVLSGAWTGIGAAAAASLAEADGRAGERPADAAALRAKVAQAVDRLQAVLQQARPLDDWTAFALARSGRPVADRYLPEAERAVAAGGLTRVTDWARTALAVNANGGDVRRFGKAGTDLLAVIANHERMTVQGPNAPAFALLALDAGGYPEAEGDRWTRQQLIGWLLDHRNADGGWSLVPGASDVDVTAIVLTALAPYRDDEEVGKAVDGALAWLAQVQRDSGGFGHPAESAESTAQALIALVTLGIDPVADERFVKPGGSALSRLLAYRLPDGRFAHVAGGGADAMASLQAMLALTAVERFWNGLPGVYAGAPVAQIPVEVLGPDGLLAEGAAPGATALEALLAVLEEAGIVYEVERHPQFGAFLKAVAGYGNGRYGGYDGWQYAVRRGGNWLPVAEGLGSFKPVAGDRIVVYYGDIDTAPVSRVTTDPAQPQEGRPFAVLVEKETTDWQTGERVIRPAAGATVRIGGKEAVTDENGRAQIPALPAGTYELTVEGYRKDAPLAYLPWQSSLTVAAYGHRVSVVVEGDDGTVAAGETRAATALEALERVLQESRVPYDVQTQSWGRYVAEIGGLSAGKYGGYDGWMYAVWRNGTWVVPAVGIDAFTLEDGDRVFVYYGDTGTRLADPVRVEPARPRPGEPLTVSVTYREWDWNENRFSEAKPLAGVTVRIGDHVAVTDEAGRATVPGLDEGVYAGSVTGYRPDGAPLVVRTPFRVTVAGVYADESQASPWAADAIRTARAVPLLLGPDNAADRFAPRRAATRAEFVAAVVRALGLQAKGDAAFADVPADAWYAPAVRAAAAAGIVGGYGNGVFGPDAPVTREQAAAILARAMRLAPPAEEAAGAGGLKDAAAVAPYARDAVRAVLAQGWMTAYAGRFAPKAPVTREQAAVIAVRLYEALDRP